MLYKREKKKLRNRGGVWTEEEMREKKWDGWGGMYVSGGGEKKKKGWGYMGGGEKKKEIKKKKEMGSGVYVYGGKKGRVEKERRKKNWKGKN